MLKIKVLFLRSIGMAMAFLCGISAASGAPLKALHGHVPGVVPGLKFKGDLPGTNELRMAIGLPLRNTEALKAFIDQLYDPKSPGYRQFLTQDEFNARFGPTAADYEAVKAFAVSNGLTIVETCSNRILLDVTGPASAVEKAFHVKLHVYRHPTEDRDFFAPDTEPTVDAALPVVDVQGISDFPKPHPRFVAKDTTAPAQPKNGTSPDGSGDLFGNDFRNAYAPGVTLTGAGQSVCLFEADGFTNTDITAYANAAGNGRNNIVIQTVLVDSYRGKSGSGNLEVCLDIEMAMSMAPGLTKIIVVEGNPRNYIPNDILNSMLSFSGTAKNLSSSWGWSGGPSTTTDNIFTNMAAVGQTYFNASGDSCAFTAGASSVNGVDNASIPNGPSSSPIITQVGGTTLTMNGSGASYANEVVWNWGTEIGSQYNGVGSSGGISSHYTIPAWQAGVANLVAAGGSTSFRNIPDVAADADNVYVKYGNGKSTDGIGGTSCAAPLWAGFMALVNQQAAANSKPPVGFANPALYSIAAGPNYQSSFNDITSGNNTWSSSPSLFVAGPGYDLCTGLGSPGGANLISALAGSPLVIQGLVVLPGNGFSASGKVGGPFNVTSQTCTLTNEGSGSLTWGVNNSAAWLNASPSNGVLAGGAQTSMTVSLASAATNLGFGVYTANVVVTNSAGPATSIPFTLKVGQSIVSNGGFETGDFSGWTLTATAQYSFVTTSNGFVHTGADGAQLGQSGSLGTLTQSIATIPGQNYLLSFWLENPTNATGATPNQFEALWNGTTLYNQSNLPFFAWTNLQFLVTATGPATTLEFDFEHTPYYFGLDDVGLVPVSAPVFKTAQPVPGAFNFSWSAVLGLTYQVQYNPDLGGTNWINLGPPQVATNGMMSFSDTSGFNSSPQGFYRVIVLP